MSRRHAACFRSRSRTATRFGAHRVVLVGEAAHMIPPIGAQGLNLGLRDAATMSELVVGAHRKGLDVGGSQVTERYDRMRRADIRSRTLAVDLLNRSLLSDFLPLQARAGSRFFLIDRIAPLRRAAMREGVMPLLRPTAAHARRGTLSKAQFRNCVNAPWRSRVQPIR